MYVIGWEKIALTLMSLNANLDIDLIEIVARFLSKRKSVQIFVSNCCGVQLIIVDL